MGKWLRRVSGVLTLGGGFAGIAVIAAQFLSNVPSGVSLTISIAFILVFAWGLVAGVLVLEGSRLGTYLSLPYWLLQVPYFALPWVLYEFSSGAQLALAVRGVGFSYSWSLGARFNLFFGSDVDWFVGVNIFALAMFVLLLREGSRAGSLKGQAVFHGHTKPPSQTPERTLDGPVPLSSERSAKSRG